MTNCILQISGIARKQFKMAFNKKLFNVGPKLKKVNVFVILWISVILIDIWEHDPCDFQPFTPLS